MPLEKIAVFLVIGKQRRQALESLGQRHTLRKPVNQLIQRHLLALCAHGRAPCGKKMAVRRGDGGFLRQVQGADKGVARAARGRLSTRWRRCSKRTRQG